MRCNFVKDKDMIRALAIYVGTGGNVDSFLPGTNFNEELAKAFSNPEDAKNALLEHFGKLDEPKPEIEPVVIIDGVGNYNRDESSDNIATYYVGGSGFMRMQQRFKKDILKNSVLDIDLKTGKYTFVDAFAQVTGGVTQLQQNILLYKNSLINILASVDDKIIKNQLTDLNISNADYTNIITNILTEFENYLKTHDQATLEVNGIYDAYVILKNFDKLIESNTPFIKIDKSFRNQNLEGIAKYLFDTNVSHYSGFTSDDSADISRQISGLAETLLQIIPEVEWNGNVLESSPIGKSGFNGAMQTLKEALLYTNVLGEEIVDGQTLASKFRETFNAGAGALLNSEYGLAAMIDAFIEANQKTNDLAISSFDSYRQRYLHNKLNGIKTYLLSKNTPEYIKNMFVQMFLKTEATSYRVYTFDPETESFMGKNLVSRMTLNQKYAFQSVISSGLKMIVNSTRSYASNIANKYDINIKSNGSSELVTITNKQINKSVMISYNRNSNGIMDISQTSSVVNDDNEVVQAFLQDVYNYVIPDTYANCVTNLDNYDWRNDFAPFIVLAAKQTNKKLGKEYGADPVIINSNNEIDVSKFNRNILAVAERLGVIYGNSIRNTVKSLSGNNLPLFQLTSLEYNWKQCLDDVRKHPNPFNMQTFNLLYDNEDLVVAPQIRNEIDINGKTKSPTQLSVNELNKLGIVDDFFFEYLRNKANKSDDAVLYLQNATFSDKSKQFLPGFKLNHLLHGYAIESVYGKAVTLEDIIDDIIKNGDAKITNVIYNIRKNKYLAAASKLLKDYNEVFNFGFDIDAIESGNMQKCVNALNVLDKWMFDSKQTIKSLEDAFYAKGVDFKREFHAYQPKVKTFGKARVNETILAYCKNTTSLKAWNEYENKIKGEFGNNISSLALHGFDRNTNTQIEAILKWANENNIDLKEYYNPITKEFKFVNNGNLNKIADAYYYIEQLLTNEFNSLEIGEIWAHPNKNNDTKNYEKYSIANRLANQIKRSVIFGSTIHPFAQNIKDQNGYFTGVTDQLEIAVIDDEAGDIYTINGVSSTVDSQDGSGHCTALEAYLENQSLVDAAVGVNKKTIVHDIDPETGEPLLLKWAVYALTNDVRRMGYDSKSNVESLVKKMYSKHKFNIDLNLDKDFDEYKRNGGQLYTKDIIAGGEPKLVTKIIKNSDGSFQRAYEDGTLSRKYYCNTLYEIDQLFGGAWTYNKNEKGKFIPNEESVSLLASAAIKYNLRDKQVAYAVNTSACKVGATNVNSSDVLKDENELRTFKVHSKYAGVMMNADHELDIAEVTEMSQMISALIEDGHYTKFVTDIYKNIGNIALNNDKINKIISIVKSNDPNKKQKMMEIIGKSLIASFSSGAKDTIGLAQAFIKKASQEFQRAKSRGEDYEFTIPISDPTIYGAFVSDVVSSINKAGIRRKYEGFAGVLNPSYNMVQYYSDGNRNMLFSEFNDYCQEQLMKAGISPALITSSWVNFARNNPIINGKVSPLLREINRNEIDFEDTVVIIRPDQSIIKYYIKDAPTYELVKHQLDFTGCSLYIDTAEARNLRGTGTYFNVSDGAGNKIGTFNIFDLDSVRAAQFINELGNDRKLNGDATHDFKVNLINKVLAENPNAYGVTDLDKCNNITQDILEIFDEKGEIPWQTSFGENLGQKYFVDSYYVRPAEIIAGRYQMEKLGLGKNDHIYDVTGPEFFLKKLQTTYGFPKLNGDTSGAYDKILYHNGQPVLVKIDPDTFSKNNLELLENNDINIVGEDIKNGSEVVITTNNPDKFKFSTLTDKVNKYLLITVASEEDFNELYESQYFDDVYRNNIDLYNEDGLFDLLSNNNTLVYNGNYINKNQFDLLNSDEKYKVLLDNDNLRVNKQLEIAAKTRYEAFKRGIELIGARIPTQAMQSFMPFRVIAFSNCDENAVYVPVANTAIEGSDYDIDKLYLLAASILKNGTVSAGSSLQKYVGFDVASKLYTPRGNNIVAGNTGVKVNGTLLTTFTEDPNNWSEITKSNFISIVNKIGNSVDDDSDISVNFENTLNLPEQKFQKQVRKFLSMVNKHSKTPSYIRDSMEALKSKVFSGIFQVTTFAQNQMKAQIMVDACTGELKRRAADTVAGSAEKLITPDNPASKYIMQEQCMLGKAVVGIGAVSLKTYFILSTMNQQKAERCTDLINAGNYELAENVLKTMVINGPYGITTIANTNLRQIQRALNRAPETQETNRMWSVLNALIKNSQFISAPEFLSGIISLAADNAKDLALPKLNATSDLVDIYTTSAMLGIPFQETARIMTSDIFNWMTKAGANDIFDDYTDGNKVKKMVKFILFQNFGKLNMGQIYQVINKYNNWAPKHGKPVINTNNVELPVILSNILNISNIKEFLSAQDGMIQNAAEYMSEEAQIAYDRLVQDASDQGLPIPEPDMLKQDCYNAYRVFENYEQMLSIGYDVEDIEILNKLLNIVTEMTTLGQQGSINQGMKTNTNDFISFSRKISDMINDKIDALNKALKKDAAKRDVKFNPYPQFNMTKYLLDPEYRENEINFYEDALKSGFNILEALAYSPNFFNMSQLVPFTEEMLKNSYAYRVIEQVSNELLDKKMLYSISQNDAKQISNTVFDAMIYSFLINGDFEMDLTQIDSDFSIYTPDKMLSETSRKKLTLKTPEEIASFKHLMETVIIPKLRSDSRYSDNQFIRDLGFQEDTAGKTKLALPIQMMNVDSDTGTQSRYSRYLDDFNKLCKDSIYGQNIGSLMFLYNLIVNKNGYGQNSLTRIFEDLIDSKNQPESIQAYYKWIGTLDKSGQSIDPNLSADILYRIKNYSRGTKIQTKNLIQKVNLNSDFTFELPYTAKLNQAKWLNNQPYLANVTTVGNIDPVEAITALGATINNIKPGTITFITDAIVKEQGLPKEAGFVMNGKIYINKSRFNNVADAIGVEAHELSHLVLAAMKVNQDYNFRNAFYKLLASVKNDPDYNKYMEAYPDLVGSDLDEEIVASKIGKLIANQISNNSDLELQIVNGEMLLDAFNVLFNNKNITLRDIVNSNTEYLLENFAKNIFSFTNEINEDFIKKDQRISGIKTRLFNSTNSNWNLKQDCK